ncbi:flagellar motor protein MotB [candidate division KSB1 bacterium]|nr:flagellar motor protein MotB [candidate division KSB1 bacterium]
MNTFSTFLLILFVLLLGISGYFYLDKVSPLQSQLKEIRQENEELGFRVEQLEQQNAVLTKQVEQKVQELSDAKNEEINQLKSTYEDLIGELKEQVEAGEITITQLADQLKVRIVDRIIFPSGEAELSEEGMKVLGQVGGILKQTKDKRIKVEGHTDNVPIHLNLKSQFDSNWELSVTRATNVVRFLTEEVGLNAESLEASGFGEHRPIATNKTRRGRAKNRRIEIRLLPQNEDILRIAEKRSK